MNWLIRKLLAVLLMGVSIICSPAMAEFSFADSDRELIRNRLGIFEVGDLAVGEVGYTLYRLCHKDGQLMLPKTAVLVSERRDYSQYFKVKRLPAEKVEVELIPSKSGTKNDVTKWFLKRVIQNMSTPSCDFFVEGFGMNFLIVDSVNGSLSVSELASTLKD